MHPFFSIIVPCCDVEPYVRECLDSVLKQPFTDWECIIGVETSKDNTEAIVREYEANDSRFKVFTGPRTGSCSASRNTGIDMAQGEYVIFLDGDDTIVEGSLQRLHDKIAARPDADLYPCAMLVHNEMTGKDEPTRDNYPLDFNGELTGPEATIKAYSFQHSPCPMLQLTVFRRLFLIENDLKCIVGLRRQDSEFSPRALYYAKKVIPLHEQFYNYRIRASAIGTGAKGAGYFLEDWAIILKSLFAFHSIVSKESLYNKNISIYWSKKWINILFYYWFSPNNISTIPRKKRTETLIKLFSHGFDDFEKLQKFNSLHRRFAGWWVKKYVCHPFLRYFAELFFQFYFHISSYQ